MARHHTLSRAARLSALTVTAVLAITPLTALAPTAASASGPVDGPDVSAYQHPRGATIDWAAVKRSGREFAIVKATEAANYVNPYFAKDYGAVRNIGMVRGSYHFARPGWPMSTAVDQARFYVSRLGSVATTRTLPPALDLEVTGGLSRAALVTWAQDFLITVRKLTGRTPMVYSYPWFWANSVGDAPALARYPLWMASYSSSVTPAATLWQYTAGAKVSGIRGAVDMSRYVGSSTGWSGLADGTHATAWPGGRPGVVQSVRGHAGDRSATVTWLPGDSGTRQISGFTVVLSPGGKRVQVNATTWHATFTGLSTHTSYRFTVTASNSLGSGPVSAWTAPVTPYVAQTVTASLSATRVAVNHSVTLSGRVTPAVAGQKVLREGYYGGAWHVWATGYTSSTGAYSFRITPTVRTVDVYRVVAVATAERRAGVSPTRRLTVY
jgi:lysozyme